MISRGFQQYSRQQRLMIHHYDYNVKRNFSVKELSWCKSPSTTLSKKQPNKSKVSQQQQQQQQVNDNKNECLIYKKMKFGIVAAMDQNRVIGINGSLPWNLPKDRQMFVNLTRNKVLIIGRHTFHERPTKSHISHLRHCIVVSNTMKQQQEEEEEESAVCGISVVPSFTDALKKAFELQRLESSESLDCWIGGGQRIYEEAIRHPSAYKLHLTYVKQTPTEMSNTKRIAQFPPKYRWDTKFKKVKDVDVHDPNADDNVQHYKFLEYHRIT